MEIHEYHDEYSESLESDFRKLEGALVSDQVGRLAPSEPIKLPADATVRDALTRMVEARRSAVVVVDGEGRLIGIFNERDMLTRVDGRGLDPKAIRLGEVMTPDPETLAPDDLICEAINRMQAGGYRTVPLVDSERRPVGIVTVHDVVQWLAELFPETIVNRPPHGKLKRPHATDGG